MRILLVDDHLLFRKGLAALLEAHRGMTVVGEAGTGEEAVTLARQTMPDVILMDIQMPGLSGLEATRRIKAEMPHARIVILTVSDDDKDLFAAIKNGADGYLLKDLEPRQLYEMLEGLRHGQAPISGALAARILKEFRTQEARAVPPEASEELTEREKEVLQWVAKGASNREIAEGLSISENTVKIHLRNILEKLHLRNRIQAAVYAVREGLAGDEPLE
ncbi:MAG: response regulator transcription factor [Anaerolineae bacterium]|nr:response regulator transcription factor [Anaerolineae bacterium]